MPFRPQLDDVQPYKPQPPLEQLQHELGVDRVVKLASNEGAFGPPAASVRALARAAPRLNRYPDGASIELRERLALVHRLKADQIVIGNGADELIRLAGIATLEPGDRAVIPWPSFPTFVSAATTLGAEACRVALDADFRIDLDGCLAAIDARTRIIFIANPNNPTGTLLGRAELREFLDTLPERVLCVLDEAYAEFARGDNEPEGAQLVRDGRERLLVLRTFSKLHGLAGLRVGYALGSRQAIGALNKVRNTFNVNSLGQAAALAALGVREELEQRIEHVLGARQQIFTWLALAGHHPVPSRANFVFARTGSGSALSLADRLLRQGVAIRALDGFGDPEAIRVTVGTDDENQFFAAALDRVTNG